MIPVINKNIAKNKDNPAKIKEGVLLKKLNKVMLKIKKANEVLK